MNKFAKLFAGMAVISLAASCSSDEPMGPNGGNDNAEGATLYMAVNIQDDSSRSRADQDNDGTDDDADGGYGNLNPDATEHNVNSARFFFFDESGVFVTEVNVWSGGTPTEGKVNNVEFKSTTMIVLKGLKDKSLPKYLFTVVNCPSTFKPAATLAETARQTSDIKNGDNFVMSTSSFNPDASQTGYNSSYPYANYLSEDNFYTEPKEVDKIEKPVVVYVERLATKTTFETTNGYFEVKVTVAGNPNNENETENDNVAKTSLYVKIDGFAVTNVETESYMAKNIDGFKGLASTFGSKVLEDWTWNKWGDFRSIWGMSTTYGTSEQLAYAKYSDAIVPVKDDKQQAFYSYETTNTVEKIKNESSHVDATKVPCAVFTATVYSKTGEGNAAIYKPADLVEYAGIYYQERQFVQYGMNRLKGEEAGLKFYTYTGSETEPTTDTETKNFLQIESKYVTIQKKESAGTGVVELCADETALEGVTLYTKNAEGKFETTDVDDLNTRLAEFTTTSVATAFKGGKMYYTVPVKHLRVNTAATNSSYPVSAEGQYGMVRNHWYQLSVGKVMKLGHGVFDPESDEEILVPDDPEDDTYGLGAQINILSWKIVKQTVDL